VLPAALDAQAEVLAQRSFDSATGVDGERRKGPGGSVRGPILVQRAFAEEHLAEDALAADAVAVLAASGGEVGVLWRAKVCALKVGVIEDQAEIVPCGEGGIDAPAEQRLPRARHSVEGVRQSAKAAGKQIGRGGRLSLSNPQRQTHDEHNQGCSHGAVAGVGPLNTSCKYFDVGLAYRPVPKLSQVVLHVCSSLLAILIVG
jgi:hypothetical protein